MNVEERLEILTSATQELHERLRVAEQRAKEQQAKAEAAEQRAVGFATNRLQPRLVDTKALGRHENDGQHGISPFSLSLWGLHRVRWMR
eukprot:1614975-Amphidinium_carterae.1